MAIDWEDLEVKFRIMKAVSARGIELTHAVNTGVIAGENLHADTINALKTVQGPLVRTATRDASDDLDAAMTP